MSNHSSRDCEHPRKGHDKGATKADTKGGSARNKPSCEWLGTKYKEKVANTTAPLTLVPNTLAIVDSGCTSHFLGPSTPCTNKSSTSKGILVGLQNGSSIRASHTALLPFPQLPIGARLSNVFPALGKRNLISIGHLFYHWFSATFTSKELSLTVPNTTLTGTRNTNNRLYYIDLQHLEPAQNTHLPQHSPCSNNVHTLSTKSEIMQYIHQEAFSPVVSTWTTSITAGLFTTGLVSTPILSENIYPKA